MVKSDVFVMRESRRPTVVFICLLTIVVVAACHAPPRAPDLGGLYNELAQSEDPYRNPVILIPGILGSKLVDRSSGSIVWGTFGFCWKARSMDRAAIKLIEFKCKAGAVYATGYL